MKRIKLFIIGAFVGFLFGFAWINFAFMFHHDAVPHYLYPLLHIFYWPLSLLSSTAKELIDNYMNYLIEHNNTPTSRGDWPYEWKRLYELLQIAYVLTSMAISYGLTFILFSEVKQFIYKKKKL
jgi:ABC-type phosphate/phosphonate transport system permease subunit